MCGNTFIWIMSIFPTLYFTHKREVFNRDGVWLAYAPFMKMKPTEKVEKLDVRCRTIGDITCTGLTLSKANTLKISSMKWLLPGLPKEAAGMMTNGPNPPWRTGRRRDIFKSDNDVEVDSRDTGVRIWIRDTGYRVSCKGEHRYCN